MPFDREKCSGTGLECCSIFENWRKLYIYAAAAAFIDYTLIVCNAHVHNFSHLITLFILSNNGSVSKLVAVKIGKKGKVPLTSVFFVAVYQKLMRKKRRPPTKRWREKTTPTIEIEITMRVREPHRHDLLIIIITFMFQFNLNYLNFPLNC